MHLENKDFFAQNQRIEYIDIAKGMGIILMIMGHIGYGELFHRFIHAFHMPLFYFCAGLFFKEANAFDMRNYIKKKAKRLLVPYIFFALIHFAIYWAMNLDQDLSLFRIMAVNILFFQNADAFPIAGALWFLVSIFMVETGICVMKRIISSDKRILLCLSILGIFATVYTRVIPYSMPFTLDSSFVGAVFYYVAFFMRKEGFFQVILNKLQQYKTFYIIFSVGITALILINETINMRVSWYGTIPLLWWFNAFSYIIVLLSFTQKWSSFRMGESVRKYIGNIGKNSMVYLCCNQLIILLLMKIPFSNTGGYKALALVLVLAILGMLDMLFHTKYLRKVIGVD